MLEFIPDNDQILPTRGVKMMGDAQAPVCSTKDNDAQQKLSAEVAVPNRLLTFFRGPDCAPQACRWRWNHPFSFTASPGMQLPAVVR